MKLAIKSLHIFIDSQTPPFSGYILIDGSYIEALIPLSLGSKPDFSSYELLDYTDYYVMPGIIDLNTHLNSAYNNEWQEIEAFTKQALTGGVTTIIDNPVMNHKEGEDINEIHNIEMRKKALEGKISVDVGLLAYLGSHNYADFLKIYEETGVLGFKIYFAQAFEENLPTFELRDLTVFSQLMKQSKIEDLILSINCEMASNRDLYMSSPCRHCPLDKRLDLHYDIHNFSGFGGGHHGVFQAEDDEDQFRKKTKSVGQMTIEDSSLFDIINEIKALETPGHKDNISPSTAFLNLNSKLMSNVLEQKHISDLELMDYEESGFPNKDETYDNSTNQFDFNDYDSNLEFSASSLQNLESSPNVQIENIDENIENSDIRVKQQNSESDVVEIMLSHQRQPKRFDSCPFFKGNNFYLKNVFDDAFEEIKGEESQYNSDKSNESNSSMKRSSISSFGERRKTFIQTKNGKPDLNTPSKFRNVALIKTKTPVHQEKEMKKNRTYLYFLPNHPVSWEINGLNVVLTFLSDLSNQQRIILTNLSSPCLAFQIRETKKIISKLNIFTDTAAPFLFFNKDDIKIGETKMKCSPPIRDKENQYFLVRSVKALIFDSVSSYHLAVPEKFKSVDEGNFRRAFNGISSIGGTLSMLWTKFYSILRIKQKKKNRKDIDQEELEKLLKKIVYLTSENPSKMLFLDGKKGMVKKGFLADLMIWDPFKITKIQEKNILLRNKNLFCLKGMKVYGEVVMTILGGKIVFKREANNFIFRENEGMLLFNKAWSHK